MLSHDNDNEKQNERKLEHMIRVAIKMLSRRRAFKRNVIGRRIIASTRASSARSALICSR
jgi:hypothetical protein